MSSSTAGLTTPDSLTPLCVDTLPRQQQAQQTQMYQTTTTSGSGGGWRMMMEHVNGANSSRSHGHIDQLYRENGGGGGGRGMRTSPVKMTSGVTATTARPATLVATNEKRSVIYTSLIFDRLSTHSSLSTCLFSDPVPVFLWDTESSPPRTGPCVRGATVDTP